jgi:adenylate cyclase class 2
MNPLLWVLLLVCVLLLAAIVAIVRRRLNYISFRDLAKTGGEMEFERAYFAFDEGAVRRRLAELGAAHRGVRLFRINMYRPGASGLGSLRVRDEGARVTMTAKRPAPGTAFNEEHEVVVDSFEGASKFVDALGFERGYFVEKLRDIFVLDGAEVVFDTYPGLPSFIEIEAPSEPEVHRVASLLGLSRDDPQDRGAGHMYRDLYGIALGHETSLTFDGALATLGPLARQGVDELASRVDAQRALIAGLR